VTTRTSLIGAERREAKIKFEKSEMKIFSRTHLERTNHLDGLHEIRLSRMWLSSAFAQ
jgi:hypothetical protein